MVCKHEGIHGFQVYSWVLINCPPPAVAVAVYCRYMRQPTTPALCIAATGTTPHTAALVDHICANSNLTLQFLIKII